MRSSKERNPLFYSTSPYTRPETWKGNFRFELLYDHSVHMNVDMDDLSYFQELYDYVIKSVEKSYPACVAFLKRNVSIENHQIIISFTDYHVYEIGEFMKLIHLVYKKYKAQFWDCQLKVEGMIFEKYSYTVTIVKSLDPETGNMKGSGIKYEVAE